LAAIRRVAYLKKQLHFQISQYKVACSTLHIISSSAEFITQSLEIFLASFTSTSRCSV